MCFTADNLSMQMTGSGAERLELKEEHKLKQHMRKPDGHAARAASKAVRRLTRYVGVSSNRSSTHKHMLSSVWEDT
jgi:hypothetical protein